MEVAVDGSFRAESMTLAERVDPQRYPAVAVFVQGTQLNTVLVDHLRELIASCVHVGAHASAASES